MKYYDLFMRNSHLNNIETCQKLAKDMAFVDKVPYVDMLRKIGQEAVKNNDYPTFNMVSKLKRRFDDAAKK